MLAVGGLVACAGEEDLFALAAGFLNQILAIMAAIVFDALLVCIAKLHEESNFAYGMARGWIELLTVALVHQVSPLGVCQVPSTDVRRLWLVFRVRRHFMLIWLTPFLC